MSPLILRGDTVDLYCGGVDHIDAEGRDVAELCAMLGVALPPEWPPLHNDENTRAWLRNGIVSHPGSEPWWCYYVVAREDNVLCGLAGFTGPPADGEVMVGYSILPQYQRRGYASEAVRLLMQRAFADGVKTFVAETLPDLVASQGVMTNNGMVFVSAREDDDDGTVWRFERRAG